MEHRYLKILDYYELNLNKESSRLDEFAYNISFNDFEELTIELLKLAREAIIQLIMIIKIEESKKFSSVFIQKIPAAQIRNLAESGFTCQKNWWKE